MHTALLLIPIIPLCLDPLEQSLCRCQVSLALLQLCLFSQAQEIQSFCLLKAGACLLVGASLVSQALSRNKRELLDVLAKWAIRERYFKNLQEVLKGEGRVASSL